MYCYVESAGSPFSRNVRRLVNGRNTLETYGRQSNEWVDEWKRVYCLFSKQQQLYFWSYIVSIVSIMKYIDIEFQYQLICKSIVLSFTR